MSRLTRLLKLEKIETHHQQEELIFFLDCLIKGNIAKIKKIARLNDQKFKLRKILQSDVRFYSNLLVRGYDKKISEINKELDVSFTQLVILKALQKKLLKS